VIAARHELILTAPRTTDPKPLPETPFSGGAGRLRKLPLRNCQLWRICSYVFVTGDDKPVRSAETMSWTSQDSFVTRLFSGDPWIILLAFITTLALPTLLHLYFYTTAARVTHTPAFILLGPTNSGKTGLLDLVKSHRSVADPRILTQCSYKDAMASTTSQRYRRLEHRRSQPQPNYCYPHLHPWDRISTARSTIRR
jgi:hypothetical protein